jgi:ribonuclease HI
VVVTDSKYVVDGMNSWVAGWKSRGWKKADGKAPENVELWMKLDQKINSFFEVKFQWVRGHGGHPQNERCDQLANKAMDEAFS